MREIKFRVYVKSILTEETGIYIPNYISWMKNGDRHDIDKAYTDEYKFSTDTCTFTLMQYTGLKDKNGVEIYEGDIVAVYPHMSLTYDLGEATICEVKWSSENAGWVGVYANISAWSRHEVIGNIFENPELLEGGDK